MPPLWYTLQMHDYAAYLFAFVFGLIAGGGVLWLYAQTRLIRATAALEKHNAVLTETLEQERKQSREKTALEAQVAQHIQKQNREEIGAILTPLQEKLREFQQEMHQTNKESAEKRGELAEQIRALSAASAAMSAETTSLTRALKGSSQTQGAWGERVLESILASCALREGEEYIAQQSHTTEDGARLRPDVLVKLPGGQHIVIDSKVSLIAFSAYVNEADDAARASHLARHLASLRAHIRELGGKNYPRAAGGDLDYVIMFVPIEGALAAALQSDPELTGEALRHNVTIATPTTLMIVLRTVANIWQVERRNRNAEEIAARAGKIYDKLAGFVQSLREVGARLDQAQAAYADAFSKLATGKGNLLNQVEQLKSLGAKTSKSLPGLAEEPDAFPTPDAEDAA